MFRTLDISATGLRAQRTMMNTISQNIANAHSTRDEQGNVNPYRRREVVFRVGDASAGLPNEGVGVAGVQEDFATDFIKKFEPNHPDAIKTGKDKGYVYYPNVNVMHEMVDMLVATRAYEANVTAMESTKSMVETSFKIIA